MVIVRLESYAFEESLQVPFVAYRSSVVMSELAPSRFAKPLILRLGDITGTLLIVLTGLSRLPESSYLVNNKNIRIEIAQRRPTNRTVRSLA